jgi:hypothetical protein
MWMLSYEDVGCDVIWQSLLSFCERSDALADSSVVLLNA